VERGILLQNAPFLVHPLPFVMPVYQGDRHPLGLPFTTPGGIGLGAILDMGLWMYDGMAGRRGISRHRRLNRQTVLQYAPDLVSERLREGFLYYDGQTDDARLTLTLLRTAAEQGASVINYAEVISFTNVRGKINGVVVQDALSGAQIHAQARHIVNATGIFAERVEALTGTRPAVQVEPSKGVHLVLSREDIRLANAAIVLPETEDRRILFLVPWHSRVIFGTTDTVGGNLDQPTATHEDIAYLLKYLNRYFALNLTAQHVISTYSGYRPLFKPGNNNQRSTARLSRTHAVLESPSGLVTIVGGKLTTYRRMAQDTVDLLERRDRRKPTHPTLQLPLAGGANWAQTRLELEQQGAELHLTNATLQHLVSRYGGQTRFLLEAIAADPALARPLIADLPYLWAEVHYAVHYEMAITPADILARRMPIALEDRQRGLGVLDEMNAWMAKAQGQPVPLASTYRAEIESQMLLEQAP
jgi:glycerol-3-phosphate dehydrogenase